MVTRTADRSIHSYNRSALVPDSGPPLLDLADCATSRRDRRGSTISPPPSCWKPRPTSDLAPARSERDLRESGPAAHAHRTRREQRRRGLPAVAWYRSYPLPTSLGKLCAGVRGAISVNEARSDNTVVASGTWGAWRCWAPKFALTWGPEITHRRVSRQLGRWNSRPRPMRAIYQNRGQYHPHERDSSR